MTFQFTKAKKEKLKLRLALIGPAGTGKTYTALSIATGLDGKIAVLDSEKESAKIYADQFDFDHLAMPDGNPKTYIGALQAAADAGYTTAIIDSLSHAWMGKDGALELVDKASGNGNSFAAWRKVTPLHNTLVDTMLSVPMHVIVTLRAKTDYVQEKDDRGKTTIRKVGLAPVQRDGLEYEFTVVGDLDQENTLHITKSRYSAIKNEMIREPGAEFGRTLLAWLDDGADFARATDEQIASLEDFLVSDAIEDKLKLRTKELLAQHKQGRLGIEKAQQAIDALTGAMRQPQQDTKGGADVA